MPSGVESFGGPKRTGAHWQLANIIKQLLIDMGYRKTGNPYDTFPDKVTDKFMISDTEYAIRHKGMERPIPDGEDNEYLMEQLWKGIPAVPEAVVKLTVDEVNHRTKDGKVKHPFVIGDAHLNWAHESNNGRLAPAMQGCPPCAESGYPYDEFISDKVVFIHVKAAYAEDKVSEELKVYAQALADLLKEWGMEDGVAGFAFVKGN